MGKIPNKISGMFCLYTQADCNRQAMCQEYANE